MTGEVPAKPVARIAGSDENGVGCLAWTARIPAVSAMVVLIGSVLDLVRHGPEPAPHAVALGIGSGAALVVFVLYGALLDARFDPWLAVRRLPKVFFIDVVLFVVVAVIAFLSHVGAGVGDGGGGGGGGGGGSRNPVSDRRHNFASSLVDESAWASLLGVASVRSEPEGFDSTLGSLAMVTGTDARGRVRTRLWVKVTQGPTAEVKWARAQQSAVAVAGPGDGAVSWKNVFMFKRGDTVVDMKLTKSDSSGAPDLAAMASTLNERL